MSNANVEWNSVLPIGITETSFNYALNYVYGGTRDQLLTIFPSLSTTTTGMTVNTYKNTITTITYSGTYKYVRELVPGNKMCVVERTGTTANQYKNTATHEMGHLFGWNGHSNFSTDIMYYYQGNIINLTERDKTHIKQIYDLMY